MQIDFHHGVTYVVARLAGFDHEAANTIAYAAQYVDDATNSGLIRFNNGALFSRISSAHKMLDYRNFNELANHRVWLPFHFLPGNAGLPIDQDPPGEFIEKLICYPNSFIAQDMVRECIARQDAPYGLHRLGITMHVYADTWAHQGFAGVNHQINEARGLMNAMGTTDRNLMTRLKGYFISGAFPLGHGAVLGNPDKPFLRWGYINGQGKQVWRDNPQDFLAAAEKMYQVMQCYQKGNPELPVHELPEPDKSLIDQMFRTLTSDNRLVRHQEWLQAIAAGKFSFGAATVYYKAKGKNSWKYLALQTEGEIDREDEVFAYHPHFLTSDWKLFHDALQAHHFYIIHELLPQYRICVA